MADYGARYADKRIRYVDSRLREEYQQAKKELTEKLDDFVRKSAERDKLKQKQRDAGLITEEEYNDWLRGQVFMRERWEKKLKQVQEVIYNHNVEAARIVHDNKIDVFAENYNWSAYEAEKQTGISFDIINENTLANLVKKNPQILPEWKIDEEKDYKWNYRKANNSITQGIIQGESVDKITKRLVNNLCTQNKNKMRTFARTAITGAQNSGRQAQMDAAAEDGIEIMKEWVATHDGRTRDVHRELDGQQVLHNKPFESSLGKIEYPGDPSAAPANVYNCRCAMIAVYPEYRSSDNGQESSETIVEQDYKEWERIKHEEANPEESLFAKMSDEEKYERIWLDIIGEDETLEEYKSKVSDETAKQVDAIIDKAKGKMDRDTYWDFLRDGVGVNTELDNLIFKSRNERFEQEKEKPKEQEHKKEEKAITVDKAGKGKPSQKYIERLNERFGTASEAAQKVYKKYIPKGGGVLDGASLTISQYQPWIKGEKKIVMSYKKDEKNINGIGQTWFHEHGHYIDYALGRVSRDDNFLRRLRQDVADYEKRYARATKRELTDKVKDEIGLTLGMMKRHGVADVYGAISNGGMYNMCGTGHPKKYWDERDEYAPASEAFAHMFESMFDSEEQKIMERFLPTSYEWFKTIIEGAANND